MNLQQGRLYNPVDRFQCQVDSEIEYEFPCFNSLSPPSCVWSAGFDEAVSAEDIASVLRANGIVDVLGYRKIAENQLRIATFPNVDPGDVERLVAAIDYIVDHG